MADFPVPDPSEFGDFGDDVGMFEEFEPEVVDGPFGLPFVKPKGAPEPPLDGPDSMDLFE